MLRISRHIFRRLPSVPYKMPFSKAFIPDTVGMIKGMDEKKLSKARDALLKNRFLPKSAFMDVPSDSLLPSMASALPYYVLAHYAMEHGFYFLFHQMIYCKDAPLPHVMYVDFMKCKTFSSHQMPMDEQFYCVPNLIKSLLVLASSFLLTDKFYFYSCEKMFRSIEQQQNIGNEVLSAWVQCCTFAERTENAISTLHLMNRYNLAFDPTIFCYMMAPTLSPTTNNFLPQYTAPKTFLIHKRLHHNLNYSCNGNGAATGLHAMFVANSLLLRHAAKWESLRLAIITGLPIAERTLHLAEAVLEIEKGQRCGPQTMEALCISFLEAGMIEALIKTLFFARINEFNQEKKTKSALLFSPASEKRILMTLKKHIVGRPEEILHAFAAFTLMQKLDTKYKICRNENSKDILNILSDVSALEETSRIILPVSGLSSEQKSHSLSRYHSLLKKLVTYTNANNKSVVIDSDVEQKEKDHEKTMASTSLMPDIQSVFNIEKNDFQKISSLSLDQLDRYKVREKQYLTWRLMRVSTSWINPI